MKDPLVELEWLVEEEVQFDQNKLVNKVPPELANSSALDRLVHGKKIENFGVNFNW